MDSSKQQWTIGQLRVNAGGNMTFLANGITRTKKGLVPTVLTELRNQGWKLIGQSQAGRIYHPDIDDRSSDVEIYTLECAGRG